MTAPDLDRALWAFGRGSGVTALVLLTVAVVVGIAARSGRALVLPRVGLADLHRGAAVLATVAVTLHVSALVADPYAQLRMIDVVMPFGGGYRPVWVGFGTVAVDLLLAVLVSGLLRRYIGPAVFRAVHWSTYLLWPVALTHVLGAGTDAWEPWLLAVAGCCVVVVGAAVCWRVGHRFTEYPVSERSSR